MNNQLIRGNLFFRCSNLDFRHYGAEKDSDRNEEGREMVSRKPI